MVVYHLPRIPGNFGWDVNGKRCFGSSHRKIPGANSNYEKVVPFSRLGHTEWKFVYHYKFLEFRTIFMLKLKSILGGARQSGNFMQMINDTYRSFLPTENSQPKFPDFFYKW